MKISIRLLATTVAAGLATVALAQQDHGTHHPGAAGASTQAQPPAAAPGQPQPNPMGQTGQMGQMMQSMPEQCRAMMQQMMQGGMMQGGMMRSGGMMSGQAGQGAAQTDAMKGYMAAMDVMHGPMMQAVQDSDPDAGFVKGMIPHHQGAIDMAKVVLQHGKDEQVKKWANDVIREQQREIAEMEAWLKKPAK